MATGQVQNEPEDGNVVDQRRKENEPELDNLLATAEYEACVVGDETCGKGLKNQKDIKDPKNTKEAK